MRQHGNGRADGKIFIQVFLPDKPHAPCQQKAVSVKISAECGDMMSAKREAGLEIELEQIQ